MTPYSENIIFLDTEFTDLDVRVGELMSVGMVKYTGEQLYVELEYQSKPHAWVKKHVLPALKGDPVSKEEGRRLISKFVGKGEPYLVAYVNQFDAVYWYQLFGSAKEHPAYWIPIDFASILFAHGYSPNSLGKHKFYKELGIDKKNYQEHNALDDARLLAEVYKKFFERVGV